MASLMGYSQNCSFILKGHIEDADTHLKLSGANVVLVELNKEMVTDEQGDFIFNNLCQGNYTIRVTHADCETYEQKINLTKNRHLDIDLPHAKNTLSEVTLTSQKGTSNTGFKKELSSREMEESKGQSLAETLSRMNGVTMLQTGSNISKPIIHGLHSNRILTINNGVRQEGQQWGNEHAPEIDPFIAGKLMVIKGVDELKYGSDAIGGVILVEPRALMNTPGYNAEINSAWFTNNRQYVVSAVFEQQLKNLPAFTYRVQGTFKKAANATTPGYRLNNTGSEEKNFSLTAGWKKQRFSTELFYSFFDTQVGIFEGSHIGNLADLQNAINSNRPAANFTGENTYSINRPYQDVNHQLLKSKSVLQAKFHKWSLLLATQINQRKEFDIIRNSNSIAPQLDLGMVTLSQELNWEYNKNPHFIQLAGITAMQQDNQYAGRYFIPAFRSNNFGGFYIGKWLKHKWNAEAGIRYDHKNINSNRLLTDGTEFDENEFNFSTLGSSFNAGYKINKQWRINTNIALANRAPQVNELLSNGIHHGTATFEEGAKTLQPERSVNISLHNSWIHKTGKISFDLTLYSNNIRNFIYQQPKPGEPVLTIAGAFPKMLYQQNDARLQGIDFSSGIYLAKQLKWELKYALLRAKNKDKNDWLIRMPADRLQNELSYSFNDRMKFSTTYISAEYIYVLKQTRVPDEKTERQDYKDAPDAYGLLNANAGTTFLIGKIPVTFNLAVRNLLNTAYRDYLNSMRYFTDETGRNVQLRIKIPVKNIY
jgi:iron complex outermembrane recepter protein